GLIRRFMQGRSLHANLVETTLVGNLARQGPARTLEYRAQHRDLADNLHAIHVHQLQNEQHRAHYAQTGPDQGTYALAKAGLALVTRFALQGRVGIDDPVLLEMLAIIVMSAISLTRGVRSTQGTGTVPHTELGLGCRP